jgi:hypothetical protein
MAKGFGAKRRKLFKEHRRKQAFENLKRYRNKILGLAWQGQIMYGDGVIHFQETEDGGNIGYLQRQSISDPEVLQVLDGNDPQLAAVVLYDYSGWFDILTLSGPQKPPECYDKLPAHLKI